MVDTLITAHEIDLKRGIYIAIKTNLKTAKDFNDAMDGNMHNGGKYEYQLIIGQRFIASFKSNSVL